MSAALRLACTLTLLAAATAEAATTSTDVFEARAYRVDRAGESQSALAPIGVTGWGLDEAIPYSAQQAELVLRSGDPLAVWLPNEASTSLGGTRTYFDRMPQVDLTTGTVTFDRYHRLESRLLLPALTGPSESSYWIGALREGDYDFILNDWRLPGIESDPLAGLLGPPSLTTPWSNDLPDATLAASMSWRFSVIPEPSAVVLLLAGAAAFGRHRV